MKRFLSFLLTLTLLCSYLPTAALADGLEALVAQSALTEAERTQAKRLAGLDGEGNDWQEGDAIVSSSTPRQTQQYLEWLLKDEAGGLLKSMRDTSLLLNKETNDVANQQARNAMLRQVEEVYNEIAYYQQLLEDDRTNLNILLTRLGQGSFLEQYQNNRRVRELMSELEEAAAHVASVCASNSGGYEARLDALRSAFDLHAEGSNFPTESALSTQSRNAEMKTELANASLRDKDFSVTVISTAQFAVSVTDENRRPVQGASVKVSGVKFAAATETRQTDAKGLAIFEVKDYRPDVFNTIGVDVEISFPGNAELAAKYGEREARKLYVKGGYTIPFKLSPLDGEIYLKMASFNGIDVLSQQQVVHFSTKNDATFSFDVCVNSTGTARKGKACISYTPYGSTESKKTSFKSFTTGQAVSFSGQWCKTLAPDKAVELIVEFADETSGESQSTTYPLQLLVQEAVVDEPIVEHNTVFSLLTSMFSFTIPEQVPVIGGMMITFNIDEPPIFHLSIDPSGAIFFGLADYSLKNEEWKKQTPYDREELQARAGREAAQEANAVNEGVRNRAPASKTSFLGASLMYLTPIAAFYGKMAPKSSQLAQRYFELDGFGGLQAVCSADFSKTFWISGFPVFIALDLTAVVGVAAALVLQWEWNDVKKTLTSLRLDQGSGLDLSVLLELGFSAGAGIKNLLSVALRAFARLSMFVRIGSAKEGSIALTMGMQLVLQAGIIKIVKGLCDITFSDSTRYDPYSLTANANGETTTIVTAELTDEERAKMNQPVTGENSSTLGKKLYEYTTSRSEPIEYVTLKKGDLVRSFGFWITEKEYRQTTDRYQGVCWFSMDEPGKYGNVANDSHYNDYSFTVAADKDMVAIAMLSGKITENPDVPSSLGNLTHSRCDVAVLKLADDGTLQLVDSWMMFQQENFCLRYPLLYLARFSDRLPLLDHYVVSASCSWVENLDSANAKATFSKTREGYYDKVYQETVRKDYKTSTTTFTPPYSEAMCSFATGTPSNVAFKSEENGTDGSEESTASFYTLSANKNAVGAEATAYRGNLYLYRGGSYRLLDKDVSFIAPLTYNIKDIRGYDNNDFLFYLKRVTNNLGIEEYRLMSACVHTVSQGTTVTLEDHGICIPTGSFRTTIVDNGTDYGIPILYWLEYMEKATGEGEVATTTDKRAVVKAVIFDRSTQLAYGPFILAELETDIATGELKNDPINGVYVSAELADVNDQVGKLRLYFSKEHSELTEGSGFNWQDIYTTDVELTADVDFIGVTSEEPCVNPGENASMLFTVKNTGNLPVAGFSVQLYRNDGGKQTLCGELTVNCLDPIESEYVYTQEYYQNGMLLSEYTEHIVLDDCVVSRVDNVYNNLNGDLWVLEERSVPFASAARNGETVTTAVRTTNLLTPEGVHTYRAAFKIPSSWNGNVQLTAKITDLRVMSALKNAVTDPANDETPAGDVNDDVILVSGEGKDVNVTYPNVANGQRYISVSRGSSDYDTENGDSLGVGRGDMDLRAAAYVNDDGEQYVRLSVTNRATSNATMSPTLYYALGSGTRKELYAFPSVVDKNYGYTLDVPASFLLGDSEGASVVFTLQDNQTPSDAPTANDGREFSTADNQREVTLGSPLRIVLHPQDAEALTGGSATFTVAAEGGRKPYTYQWQRQQPNGSWLAVPGGVSAALTVEGVTAGDDGALYRCVVTDANLSSTLSQEARLNASVRPPQTGDAALPLLWLALAAASALVLLALFRRKRES